MAQKNKIECIIKWCVALCFFLIVGGLCYYLCHLRGVDIEEGSLCAIWYNYLSPFIAIANVIAFIGLTIAIYVGEDQRQKMHEQINIQNAIIDKLQSIERDLTLKEETFRKEKSTLNDVYSIYIAIYRYANFFKDLPSLSILETRKDEKENASKVLEQVNATQKLFIDYYKEHKANISRQGEINDDDKRPLLRQLNFLMGYIEEFEISILQDISLHIDQPE